MIDDMLQRVIINSVSLDQDSPRPTPTPGAPGNLAEQREDPLGAPKVRQVQSGVDIKHSDQGDIRKIMPFGDHLRAYQDIDLSGHHFADQAVVRSFAGSRIAVHACDSRSRQDIADFFLEPLGSHPLRPDFWAITARAFFRRGLNIITIVTTQRPGRLRIRQGDVTVGTMYGRSAVATEKKGCITTPVQQQ